MATINTNMIFGIAMLALSATWLAGCDDAPSESVMRKAVENHTRKSLANSRPGTFTGFSDFRKQGCVASRQVADAFDCYYSATLTPEPGSKPLTVNGKARFRNTDKGAVFEDLGAQPR